MTLKYEKLGKPIIVNGEHDGYEVGETIEYDVRIRVDDVLNYLFPKLKGQFSDELYSFYYTFEEYIDNKLEQDEDFVEFMQERYPYKD